MPALIMGSTSPAEAGSALGVTALLAKSGTLDQAEMTPEVVEETAAQLGQYATTELADGAWFAYAPNWLAGDQEVFDAVGNLSPSTETARSICCCRLATRASRLASGRAARAIEYTALTAGSQSDTFGSRDSASFISLIGASISSRMLLPSVRQVP